MSNQTNYSQVYFTLDIKWCHYVYSKDDVDFEYSYFPMMMM